MSKKEVGSSIGLIIILVMTSLGRDTRISKAIMGGKIGPTYDVLLVGHRELYSVSKLN